MERKKLVLAGGFILLLAVCLGGRYTLWRGQTPKGYQDYTVQKEQFPSSAAM